MSVRPPFWNAQNAARFTDPSVIAAYPYRPAYPDKMFDFLASLIVDEPRAVLDLGCGPGNLARPLAARVVRLDAVDLSPGMVALGTTLPGGDNPRLRWIVGKAEDAPLDPPYALITAGESLHWFDWDVALPRLAAALTTHGHLAIVHLPAPHEPWATALRDIIPRYSTIRDFQPFDMIAELERRGLFRKVGEYQTERIPLVRSADDYIEWFHSMSSFSRDLMAPDAVVAFDAEMRAAIAPSVNDGLLDTHVIGHIVWGKPLSKV